MKHLLWILCLLPSFAEAALTYESGDFKAEVLGNLEVQARHTTNSDTAKEFPLMQDWDQSQFYLMMGNLGVKASFKESKVEANFFARQAQSPLYQDGYIAPQIMNYPNRLVARDVFRLNHSMQEGDHYTDAVMNKFYYEMEGDDSRFTFGRMFINYGTGEIFNPINPFNQPLGLVGATSVAQGNDGFKASFFMSDSSTLSFYLLGDKQLNGEEDRITRTLWVHWDYRLGDNWQFDFVGGEDQKRNKGGVQINYIWGDAMVFLQTLYTSEFNDGTASENLWDAVLGYDNQFTTLWHMRLEAGYQEIDNQLATPSLTKFSGRFMPFEYFVALAQSYEIHPLVELSGTIIHDVKTDFGYGLAKMSWSVAKNWEWDFFAFSPLYRSSEANLVQRLVTTDVGSSLRFFF